MFAQFALIIDDRNFFNRLRIFPGTCSPFIDELNGNENEQSESINSLIFGNYAILCDIRVFSLRNFTSALWLGFVMSQNNWGNSSWKLNQNSQCAGGHKKEFSSRWTLARLLINMKAPFSLTFMVFELISPTVCD